MKQKNSVSPQPHGTILRCESRWKSFQTQVRLQAVAELEWREKMAEKKLVEAITSMSEDFAQWYTDVVKKAELIGYSNVKGCMVIKPAGYAIWENIQKRLDERF